MTRVLSVVSECVPLVKTGGLADVAGALPQALANYGVQTRTLLPGYRQVMREVVGRARVLAEHADLFGGRARILSANKDGLDLLVIDAPHLYDRDGSIYQTTQGHDWPDNPQRFAALSWMAAHLATTGVDGWHPDVVHMHDWQAGLTPLYLRTMPGPSPATVMTIHNIAFQGLSDARLRMSLGLPQEEFHPEGYEYYGQISALKAGLVYSDAITTVSPTYARELLSPEFGMGMEGVLRARGAAVQGILNGIDNQLWTPPFATLAQKAALKQALQAELGLASSTGPLCVVVSRLTEQKGLDILLQTLPTLLQAGGQLAVLGSGDPYLEAEFLKAAQKYESVFVRIGYDEQLAKRLIGAGDAILLPSRFEPCGLTQLYGLRFGTVPLVSLTGGLADTVIHANAAAIGAGVATGLQFYPINAQALAATLVQLCQLFSQSETWQKIQNNALSQQFGWALPAQSYRDLYLKISQ